MIAGFTGKDLPGRPAQFENEIRGNGINAYGATDTIGSEVIFFHAVDQEGVGRVANGISRCAAILVARWASTTPSDAVVPLPFLLYAKEGLSAEEWAIRVVLLPVQQVTLVSIVAAELA
jgi:hypothetical protein